MIRRPPRSTLFPTRRSSDLLLDFGEQLEAVHVGHVDVRHHEIKLAVAQLVRSEEHTSELQSPCNLVCRLLLEKKKNNESLPFRSPFGCALDDLLLMAISQLL